MQEDLALLEQVLRQGDADNFITEVSRALDSANGKLLLSVRVFAGEPQLLYVAANYASLRGVTLILVPEHDLLDSAGEITRRPKAK